MTDDQLKTLPLAQRLIISKMKDYGWQYEHNMYWQNQGQVSQAFRKKGWGATITPSVDGGFLVALHGDCRSKPFHVKTSEAACLQIEIGYRKKNPKEETNA